MIVYKIHGNLQTTKVGKVGSYKAARDLLATIGEVIAFEIDNDFGGADALVIPHGCKIADQYAVSI